MNYHAERTVVVYNQHGHGVTVAKYHATTSVTTEFVPSIENVLDSNPVSWDEDGICLVSWKVNGGRVWVPYAELRKACEAAYDSTMPSWPAMVDIDA